MIKIQLSNKLLKKFTGIVIDKKSIDLKIRQREQRQKDLQMNNYVINQQQKFTDSLENFEIFKQTDGVDGLGMKQMQQQVLGMENGRFLVNDVWYQGSLILFPRQVFLWEIDHPDQIRPHSFDIVNFIKPKPQYCILGTGKEKRFLHNSFTQKFKDDKINFDILPTFEAVSTFNVCSEDKLNVICFLIPNNI